MGAGATTGSERASSPASAKSDTDRPVAADSSSSKPPGGSPDVSEEKEKAEANVENANRSDTTNEAPNGGLAARRKLMNGTSLSVQTKGLIAKNDDGTKIVLEKIGHEAIKWIDNFADLYTLGSEVMASTNAGMDVLFATRKKDGYEVVIKTREKKMSFTNKEEQLSWRRNTEMLINLPRAEHIVQIIEVLEDKQMYYIVMEKVDGADLFEMLQSEGEISLLEMKAILRQILHAVRDLHARGCIHKDLKLENVMAEKEPSSPQRTPLTKISSPPDSPALVKLIDFDTVESWSPDVLANKVVGTPGYIAPEAYVGKYSPASDIFAVGVIAYRLISGKFPFQEAMFDTDDDENWVGSPRMKVIHDRLMRFRVHFNTSPWPKIPAAKELVKWMLANDAKKRPTAEQCLEHRVFEVTGETPRLPQAPWRAQNGA